MLFLTVVLKDTLMVARCVVRFLTVALSADGDGDGDNDEELLLVDVEKKVERCKVVELFNAKTVSQQDWSFYSLRDYYLSKLNPDLTICSRRSL